MKRIISFFLITFLSTAPALADDAKPTAPPAGDVDDDDTATPPDDQPDAPIGPAPRGPDVRSIAKRSHRRPDSGGRRAGTYDRG